MALLMELGRRPTDAYLEEGHFAMRLKAVNLPEVKSFDEQVRRWVTNNGYAIMTPKGKSDVPGNIIYSQ